jgi:hypothetical protein
MTMSSTETFRTQHPDLAFEMQNTQVEMELTNRLFLESYMLVSGKDVEIVFKLTNGYELVVRPMVRSYGGYPIWGRSVFFINEETKERVDGFRYHVHCTLRPEATKDPEFEFELQSHNLGRIVDKAIENIKQVHKKRFAAIPVLRMN